MGRGGRGGDQNKMMTAAAFLFSQHLAAAAAAPCSVLSSAEHQMTGKALPCRAAPARAGKDCLVGELWQGLAKKRWGGGGTKLQTPPSPLPTSSCPSSLKSCFQLGEK